ncbi:hypothetical protein HMN09_01118000 [Mycena chlorophos]|uniref:Uncharacterized protein n=1 Tax=Mycena chlorophos TaxID=658473 RepID=A0A8H6SBK9_MYCCL|nr:hypothetical protein HMN09_01118000 [Mycena chlorophos]
MAASSQEQAAPISAAPGTPAAPATGRSTEARNGPTSVPSAAAPTTTHSPGLAARTPPDRDDAQIFLEQTFASFLDPNASDLYNKIVTPYDPDAFEFFINKHHLDQHAELPNRLRYGFPMGDFPRLTKSVEFPNHMSVLQNEEFVNETLDEEVDAGRMDGPFATLGEVEQMLNSFVQVSPMIVSVQTQAPGEPDKRRLCRHLSKGDAQHPSTNSHVDKDKFPTRFGTASHVAEMVSTIPLIRFPFPRTYASSFHEPHPNPRTHSRTTRTLRTRTLRTRSPRSRTLTYLNSHSRTTQVANAPPGTEAMTADISKFHRTVPILPEHKCWFVVRGPKGYYIDHCAPFGAASASSNAGQIGSTTMDIWEAEKIAKPNLYEDNALAPQFPVPHPIPIPEPQPEPAGIGPEPTRVDNIVSEPLEQPKPRFAYTRDEAIDSIAPLRIPRHPTKWTDFQPVVVYIGFEWDFPCKRVSLPDQKRRKFLRRVADFKALCLSGRCTRHDVEKIHGSLCHLSFVYPEGRSYLPALTDFITQFDVPGPDRPLKTRHPCPSVITCLDWWAERLPARRGLLLVDSPRPSS